MIFYSINFKYQFCEFNDGLTIDSKNTYIYFEIGIFLTYSDTIHENVQLTKEINRTFDDVWSIFGYISSNSNWIWQPIFLSFYQQQFHSNFNKRSF